MIEVLNSTAVIAIQYYKDAINFLPPIIGKFINFFIFVLLVVIYAISVWKGYRYLSKKDPLNLNLSQYGNYETPIIDRIFTGFVFFLEYLIIIPFVISIAFILLSLFLMIISYEIETARIVFIAAILIAAVRITSYYNEQTSQEISKMLPLMLLAVFISNPNTFSDTSYVEQIIRHIIRLPSLAWDILNYILFIVVLETILRLFDYVRSIINPKDEVEKKFEEDKEENKEEN